LKVFETKDGCILEVSVKPRSREFKVAVEENVIVVFCTEDPVKGRVNKELVKELTRIFHRPVELVSGFSSRDKRLLVKGAHKHEVDDWLKRV